MKKEKSGLKETEYSVKKDEMPEVMPELEPNLKDTDRVSITSENENLTETIKLEAHDILYSLGVNILNKSPKEKQEILQILKKVIDVFNKKGYANAMLAETDKDEDTSEIDSLYSGSDDRAIEYGIQQEDFDKLMEELKKSNSPKIKVNENINPRIKKSDLINFVKTKKNVK